MVYENTTWTVRELRSLYADKRLDLCPPYQRNDVWSTRAQKRLIETMLAGWPLPTFFLLKRGSAYEMVDGQQRTRAILEFLHDCDTKGLSATGILEYRLSITVIDGLDPTTEHIETYYALVNSAGVRLNRPELSKARYYDTRFLSLVQRTARSDTIACLRLFNESGIDRMVDVDFVAELLTGLLHGITDKKMSVDEVFNNDIDAATEESLESEFQKVVDIFASLNDIYPLRSTRYRQKNDFYTLFLLFRRLAGFDIYVPQCLYRVLLALGPQISPSQDRCDTLRNYAVACVTQSNGKAARETRETILRNLLMNESLEPTVEQEDVLDLYGLGPESLVKCGPFLTLGAIALESAKARE